ncbi:hypothetical protein [Pedococcus ginsenosidimutans]|uniref:hypothetical protein n=1 Tax=Pedococcus ginsenosidimutans TaxID=490570 RepID=UPI0031F0637B
MDVTAPYPTSAEVLAVGAKEVAEWIDFTYLRHDPLAFGATRFDEFRRTASKGLGIGANGIYCLGSGAIGWSLNPEKMLGSDLKPFDRASDLDMAFVSETHFESAWRELRAAEQKWLARRTTTRGQRADLDFQRRKFFDGAILGDKISKLGFRSEWISTLPALRGIAQDALGRQVKMNFFIYRDYWSVHNSVAKSLYVCQAKRLSIGA